jgi:hypothetical protein
VLAATAPAAAQPVTASSPAAAGRAEPANAIGRSIAVLDFDALGMEPDKVARLEALFRIELDRLAGKRGPSPREISRALRRSPLRACGGESACLAAIGKKLGVELVVTGNVATLGDSHVVNIKVIEAASARELRRIASDPMRGDPDELIEAVRVAAYRLLAPDELLGSIMVLADIPGAEVRLDSRTVGRTPLGRPLARLALGPHRLEVTAKGYSPFAEQIVVRFQKTSRVEVNLAAGSAAAGSDLGLTGPPVKRQAQLRWYSSTWFLVGAGVAAAVVGGVVGYALTRQDVLDCSAEPERCQ